MPNDMRQLMQQAQQMQAQIEAAQAELSAKTYEGTAGGGVVKAVVRGSGELISAGSMGDVAGGMDLGGLLG
jgi:DNA-binding protein YbaB